MLPCISFDLIYMEISRYILFLLFSACIHTWSQEIPPLSSLHKAFRLCKLEFLSLFFFFSAVKVFLDGRFILEWSSPLSSCQLISGNFWHLCPSSVKWRAAGSCVLHHTALNTLSTSCCATHHHMFTKTRDLRLFISLCLFHLWTQYDKSCSKYYIY